MHKNGQGRLIFKLGSSLCEVRISQGPKCSPLSVRTHGLKVLVCQGEINLWSWGFQDQSIFPLKSQKKRMSRLYRVNNFLCQIADIPTCHLDSDSKRIRQKFYQFFINEKFKKIFYLFNCILPKYVPHEITEITTEFLKIVLFDFIYS